MCSLANTPIEKAWALLVEDLLHGGETQISQVNLGGLAGIGRPWMNEQLALLKELGLLNWRRVRFGANVYRLPPCYSDPKFLKLLGKSLPCFKRLCDKLKERFQSSNPEFSTTETTPIRIRSKLSLSLVALLRNNKILSKIRKTYDIVKAWSIKKYLNSSPPNQPPRVKPIAEERKPTIPIPLEQLDRERLKILKDKCPKGSGFEAIFIRYGI